MKDKRVVVKSHRRSLPITKAEKQAKEHEQESKAMSDWLKNGNKGNGNEDNTDRFTLKIGKCQYNHRKEKEIMAKWLSADNISSSNRSSNPAVESDDKIIAIGTIKNEGKENTVESDDEIIAIGTFTKNDASKHNSATTETTQNAHRQQDEGTSKDVIIASNNFSCTSTIEDMMESQTSEIQTMEIVNTNKLKEVEIQTRKTVYSNETEQSMPNELNESSNNPNEDQHHISLVDSSIIDTQSQRIHFSDIPNDNQSELDELNKTHRETVASNHIQQKRKISTRTTEQLDGNTTQNTVNQLSNSERFADYVIDYKRRRLRHESECWCKQCRIVEAGGAYIAAEIRIDGLQIGTTHESLHNQVLGRLEDFLNYRSEVAFDAVHRVRLCNSNNENISGPVKDLDDYGIVEFTSKPAAFRAVSNFGWKMLAEDPGRSHLFHDKDGRVLEDEEGLLRIDTNEDDSENNTSHEWEQEGDENWLSERTLSESELDKMVEDSDDEEELMSMEDSDEESQEIQQNVNNINYVKVKLSSISYEANQGNSNETNQRKSSTILANIQNVDVPIHESNKHEINTQHNLPSTSEANQQEGNEENCYPHDLSAGNDCYDEDYYGGYDEDCYGG